VNDSTLTIGEVAKLVGINASAIRYYESIGVLPEPDRDHGQRRYTGETVWRLQVIDIAKRAGFSLDDARQLLETENGGLLAHEQPHDLAERELPEVDALSDPDRDPATGELASRDRTAPALGDTHRGLSRIDDRGLDNLVATQRHHLRAVILTAVQLSNERHRR
jgi:DNA-binding transcriptional MerR regulator